MNVVKKFTNYSTGEIISWQVGHYVPYNEEDGGFEAVYTYYAKTDPKARDTAAEVCSYLNGGTKPSWM